MDFALDALISVGMQALGLADRITMGIIFLAISYNDISVMRRNRDFFIARGPKRFGNHYRRSRFCFLDKLTVKTISASIGVRSTIDPAVNIFCPHIGI